MLKLVGTIISLIVAIVIGVRWLGDIKKAADDAKPTVNRKDHE